MFFTIFLAYEILNVCRLPNQDIWVKRKEEPWYNGLSGDVVFDFSMSCDVLEPENFDQEDLDAYVADATEETTNAVTDGTTGRRKRRATVAGYSSNAVQQQGTTGKTNWMLFQLWTTIKFNCLICAILSFNSK